MIRLGVNVDHVATIRNARGGTHPDPFAAALVCVGAGADGITVHLREDRRHIRDADLEKIAASSEIRLNFEMAATPEMVAIALRLKPAACCLVPEKRTEVTTEGGLDAVRLFDHLHPVVQKLSQAGSRVSLFIEADPRQLDAAKRLGAPVVELHTGAYCEHEGADRERQLARIVAAAAHAEAIGLECHAGHGLTFDTVAPIAAIPSIVELNIGHFLVGEAIFSGLDSAIRRMRSLMDKARASVSGAETA